MFTKSPTRVIAGLAAVAALGVSGVATAKPVVHHGSTTPVVKHVHGPVVAAISAFPAGGKGSGTEATCALWSGQLNMDQGAVDAAEENNSVADYKDATAQLAEDKDNALDAGCVVID